MTFIHICDALMINLFVGLFHFNFQTLPSSYPRECYIELIMREAGACQIKAYFFKSLMQGFVYGHAVCKS